MTTDNKAEQAGAETSTGMTARGALVAVTIVTGFIGAIALIIGMETLHNGPALDMAGNPVTPVAGYIETAVASGLLGTAVLGGMLLLLLHAIVAELHKDTPQP